jgi:hypothetical protein
MKIIYGDNRQNVKLKAIFLQYGLPPTKRGNGILTELFTTGKSQERIDAICKMNAFQRLGEPEDIANAVWKLKNFIEE